jgi:hypothetical protein
MAAADKHCHKAVSSWQLDVGKTNMSYKKGQYTVCANPLITTILEVRLLGSRRCFLLREIDGG